MTSLPVWARAKVRASRSDADHAGTVTSNVAQWETSFKGNSMKQIVKLKVNGVEDEKAVQTHHTLLEVLRSEYKLFGAREGCGIGMCFGRALSVDPARRFPTADAFASALAYFDGYRSGWLPANLIQAQRDYFGSHTYERIDEKGTFHTQWDES